MRRKQTPKIEPVSPIPPHWRKLYYQQPNVVQSPNGFRVVWAWHIPDWDKPVSWIDRQLYAQYGLTEDEINFIETHIKPME